MTIIAALDGSKLDDDFVSRIIKSPSFNSDSIDSVILHNKIFVNKPDITDVLNEKGIKAFLKIDEGQYENGTMKNPDVHDLAVKLATYDVIGTKARSLVYNLMDIPMIVKQQLTWAALIQRANKIPIIEPEVPKDVANKGEIELNLCHTLRLMLQEFKGSVIIKLTMPDHDGLYLDLLELDQVSRIVALSGGLSRPVACEKLSRQPKMAASFSRALLEDLDNDMSDKILNKGLENNISEINAVSS